MSCGCNVNAGKKVMSAFRMRVRAGYRPGVVAALLRAARRAVERCDRTRAIQAIVAAQVAAGYRADVILAAAMVDKRLDARGCDPAESRTARSPRQVLLDSVIGSGRL